MKKQTIYLLFTLFIGVIVVAAVLGYYLLKNDKNDKHTLATELNIANWEDYFAEGVIEDFEAEYGISVNLDTYNDEEVILSLVQSDLGKYDFIVVSGLFVDKMKKLKLLAEIDLENIPNYSNIGAGFQNPSYDPNNQSSIPYLWGTTGLLVNNDYTKENEIGWQDLWDKEYVNHVRLLNDQREAMGASLKSLGHSINSEDKKQITEAANKLKEFNAKESFVDLDQGNDDVLTDKAWIAQTYSGDALELIDENPDRNLDYIIPEEGTVIWVDNMVIPRDAKNKYTAEIFINYLLRPEVSAKNASELWYANTNQAAEEYMDQEVLNDPKVYPPKKIIEKSEKFTPIGESQTIYNEVWEELFVQ
ncbi:spermidine/putrescine ABC transporter substrate-binding protein [Patescibacteria group bacterium]|nr:spermidine/putrescine ABC transporter substrate-binding protein [Patescibacteria group bacterium]